MSSARMTSSEALSPLGILGGTFDPIHFGHLRLAEEAREALHLERVRVIPAGQPPHRGRPGTAAADRLEMVRLALADTAGYEIDDAEVRSAQPSYTVPTLERLRGELGDAQPLVLLLGVDAFLGLASWHRWQALFDLAHIAVATRPGYALDEHHMPEALAIEYRRRATPRRDALARQPAGLVASFAMTPLAISATAIRALVAHGGSPRFLLPDAVLDYIQTHQLYRS